MIPSALRARGKTLVPAMLVGALFISACSTSNLRVDEATPTTSVQVASTIAAPTAEPQSTRVVAEPLSNITSPTAGASVATALVAPTVTTVQAQPTPSIAPGSTTDLVNGPLPDQQAVVQVVDKAGPAVVTVINTLDPAKNNGYQGQASGSGAVIDKTGYIVTNNHVVAGAQSLDVIFSDNRRAAAQLVGADDISDLAVLKVDGDMPAVVPLGDSDQLKVGETVIAIGSALGAFENSVTVGVVSGLHRNLPDSNGNSLEDAIQTDAAINHGNSGGPLLNLQGQVVGINSAVVRGNGSEQDVAEGLGFSIPVNTVKSITSQLISKGHIVRPYLGISSTLISPQVSAYYRLYDDKGQLLDHGVYVQDVGSGTPADKAGVQVFDAIVAINGQIIDEDHTLTDVLGKFNPGDTVTLDVIRSRQALQLKLTLGERPAQ